MKLNKLVKLRVSDFLQLKCIGLIGGFFSILSQLFYFIGSQKITVDFLLRSIRYSYSPSAQELLSRLVNENNIKFIDYVSEPAKEKDAVSRAIVLSAPRKEGDKFLKGVILLTFTHTFSFFLKHSEWENLNKYFAFVLEPSWAGYADPDILAFLQEAEHCVVQASELRDRAFVNSLFPHVPCMETGASNWVDERFFSSDSSDKSSKEYDSIYVANLTPFKRVLRAIEFVAAVKDINKNYKMVVVCASWGSGNHDYLYKYAKKLKVENNIVFYDGLPQHDLVNLVRKAKCSILLSLKEGSNRVLFESMFVDVPVICLSENIGVNKSYINASTGVIVTNKLVPKALLHMSEKYDRYSPRKWAINNISPDVTTKYLSEIFECWFPFQINRSLFVKVNSPEVSYKYIEKDKSPRLFKLLSSNPLSDFGERAFQYFD